MAISSKSIRRLGHRAFTSATLPNLNIKFLDAKQTPVELETFLGSLLAGFTRVHKRAWLCSREKIYTGKFQIIIGLNADSSIPVINGFPLKDGVLKIRRMPDV